jgi:DNA polymerase III subunit delta'
VGFETILGQDPAVGTLRRALSSGRVHHAYRFEGPDGVGKELTALAFAQALVCTSDPAEGHVFSEGCGRCSACTRAVTFARQPPRVPMHPDVVLIERGLYPPETIRRARPETQDISVDQIRRLVLERSTYAPHEGRARIFIVRRAEQLSTSAANALLKTLEEPIASMYFVLITSRGNDLIQTVRSRTEPLRFAPLSERLVRTILDKRGIAAPVAQTASELCGGSVSAALDLCDPEATQKREAFVDTAMAAIAAPDLDAAIAFAETQGRDREALADRLSALAGRFAKIGRTLAAERSPGAAAAANSYETVTRSIRELERNGSPALVVEAMVARLRGGV